MFEAKIADASKFRKIIDSFKDLVTSVNFDCTSQNIQVQAMDGAHVALVFLNMEAGFFDKYRCDRAVSLGVNVASIGRVMKCSGSNDAMRLQAEDDGNQMVFTFQAPSQDRNSRFEINLMDLDAESLQIPETSYSAELTFSSAEFAKIIRDLQNFGDTVSIQATKKKAFNFSVNGNLGKGSVVIQEATEAEITKIDIKEPITLTFSLKYLSQFCKGSALGDTVTIKLSDDCPLLVEYPFGEDYGSLKFFLAPKIESEE